MVVDFLGKVAATSPRAKRFLWKTWYQFLSRRFIRDEWTFMNYGYAPLDGDGSSIVLNEVDEQDRYYAQLYHRVACGAELSGKDVLEVGSGRGGGASYMARYLKPASMTGLDFSLSAVKLCRSIHKDDRLSFVQGDAEHLPFENEKFDVVINVESSHCYGRPEVFFGEVARVLKPGGRFLFADFRPNTALEELRSQLSQAGFEIECEEDITPNVLRAMDLTSEAKANLVKEQVPGALRAAFKDFAGIPGTRVYNSFQSAEVVYMRYELKRPEISG